MKYGYARSAGANEFTDFTQRQQIIKAGVLPENVFEDWGVSETTEPASRPGWQALSGKLSAGDHLVLRHSDRIARSEAVLLATLTDLVKQGVYVQLLNQEIDSKTADGELKLQTMLSAMRFLALHGDEQVG